MTTPTNSDRLREIADRAGDIRYLMHPWSLGMTQQASGDVRWLINEVERLRHATRLRPDYQLRCDGCGAPHWIDTSLPSEIWNQIAETDSQLCVLCIEERLAAKGLQAEALFYFAGKYLTDGTARLLSEINKLNAEKAETIEVLAGWLKECATTPYQRRHLIHESITWWEHQAKPLLDRLKGSPDQTKEGWCNE